MTIRIRQTGSPIRRPHGQRAALIGLGLNRIGRVVYAPDTPQTRGMIANVRHLVQVSLRVTFDTNVFDKVVRPQVYANDSSYPDFVVVHKALKRGDALGFISDTTITLEGIGKDQRAVVFGATDLRRQTEQVSEDTIVTTLTTEQVARQPLHHKQAERFSAALSSGIRLLGAPRVGMPRVEGGDFYATEAPTTLAERLNRFHDIMRAIERRGLGSPRAKEIANGWADKFENQFAWR